MLSFLRNGKQVLKGVATASYNSKALTFVLGNEASDLDSLCSAIGYAFLLQSQQTRKAKESPRVYIPLAGIPRSEFALRTDCDFAFKNATRSNSNHEYQSIQQCLTFIDEIDFDVFSENSIHNIEIVLTDHNKLSPNLEAKNFSRFVTGIIDHHQDSGCFPNASPRTIEPVGSATSLVVELWKNELNIEGNKSGMDPVLARLLIAPILIDTANLRKDLGRTTDKDVAALEFLSTEIFGKFLSNVQRKDEELQLYEKLQNAKSSVTHLSNRDLLRKDYKEWVIDDLRLGISSLNWFVQGENGWANRDGSNEVEGWEKLSLSIEEWAGERKLDIIIVMTSFDHSVNQENRGFEREFIVGLFGKLQQYQSNFLLEIEKTELKLIRNNDLKLNLLYKAS
ncbi:Exopolyphosphatase [Nowakowskiella sp. JEL0078]|nr:Exopolyphosphatase [Nowakowskiella sp. JEL0078]